MTRYLISAGRQDTVHKEFVTINPINPISSLNQVPPLYDLEKYPNQIRGWRFYQDRWVDPEKSLRMAIRNYFSRN